MANTLDPMDLKQIITLHLDGVTNRQAGNVLGISRNTVNRYMQLFNASGHSLQDLLKMDTASLEKLFPGTTTIVNPRYDQLMLYLDGMKNKREQPGFTFQYHYRIYEQQADDPYSYTQFIEHYHRKYDKQKGSMKLNHIAGHEMFVDYTGKKLRIYDRETGQATEVEVFVAILPYSQYTYVEACASQKREDFFQCMSNALLYYGGVPKAIVSDNLKSAVTRASKYEAVINKTFKEFSLHYRCAMNPTRAYSPQDKALVENAVNLAYQRVFYPLGEMKFFSLDELNAEIGKLLGPYNDLLFARKETSRRELFQSHERQYLKPLPQGRFQMKEYRRAKVQKIGYIYFSPDNTYYSVPYRYIGKQTQIQYTQSTVEVYYNNQRIAAHKREKEKGKYITVKGHLSSQHQAYSEWSPDYFKKKAAVHGKNVLNYISTILSFGDYPETQYKRAMGIIQLSKGYGSQRLDAACRMAQEAGGHSYSFIKNILKNRMDTASTGQQGELEFEPHIPEHKNLRKTGTYN